MDDVIKRWQRAAQRAQEEQIRLVKVHGEYHATSSSQPLGSYQIWRSPDGWACDCVANREYGMPCKHLWVLAEILDLDVLSDVRLNPELLETPKGSFRLTA